MELVMLHLIAVISLLSFVSGGEDKNSLGKEMFDAKHGVKMGILNDDCDNGAFGLNVDWSDDPLPYTCYSPRTPLMPVYNKRSKLMCEYVAEDYSPKHHCMDKKIRYNSTIPTFGDHRPIWPIFGEYRYVPPQRWLHNIEHGAVVMLYHPCTHHALVDELRQLLKKCIRKYIITPYNEVPKERPLSLVAWGCHLSMTFVDTKEVIRFVRERGLQGPEGKYPKEGQYVHELIEQAVPPKGSDFEDSNLCPNL